MKLSVIYQDVWTKEVKIEPIEIVKESEKMLYVTCKALSISNIRKSTEIPFFRNDQLITNDIEAGIAMWNERVERDIAACEASIVKLKSKRIVR